MSDSLWLMRWSETGCATSPPVCNDTPVRGPTAHDRKDLVKRCRACCHSASSKPGARHDLPRTHDRTPGHRRRPAARALRPRPKPTSPPRWPRSASTRSTTPTSTSRPRATKAGAWRKASSRAAASRIDQGVGVRAVAGEKTAFAYSDDISAASLMDAARTVRAIAAAGQSRRVKLQTQARRSPPSRLLYGTGRPDRHARQHAEGRAARAHREDGARARPAHRAGDGRPRRRARRRADRARRRHARRRRAPAGAPVDHRHRRAERPPRDGLGRRRRPLRPRLLHRRASCPSTSTRPSTRRWPTSSRGRCRPAR